MDKLRRHADDLGLGTTAPLPSGTPGKSTLTAKLFRRSNGGTVNAGTEEQVERAAGSSGAALPGDVRKRFESSLGADLSGVRVHTGAESAAAAESVGAKAYAVGQDIHFGAGQYDPSSREGLFLIAHEVAHTVQQSSSTPSRQHKLEVSQAGDAAEVDADRAAAAMVDGAPALVSSAETGIARDPDDKKENADKPKPWWAGKSFTVNPPAIGKKKGPPIEITITETGGISAKIGVEGALEKEERVAKEWPIATGGVARVGVNMSVGASVSASGSTTGTVAKNENSDDDVVVAELGIAGAGDFKVSGGVEAGVGIGIPNAASITLNGYGTLTGKAELKVDIGGSVRITKTGIDSGSLTVTVGTEAALSLAGGFCLLATLLQEDVELYELPLFDFPFADVGIQGTATASFPGGASTGDVEIKPPKFHAPPMFPGAERTGNFVRREVLRGKAKALKQVAEAEEQRAKDQARQNAEETCTPQYPEGKPMEPYGPPAPEPYGPPAPEDAKVPYTDDFRPEDEGPIKPE